MNRLRRYRSSCIWRTQQSGAVAIIVGLALVVMVGFIGLALDGGHLYLTKTELQNGADACALSASYELTGSPTISPTAFARAESAGKFVGTGNRVGFQGSAIAAGDITVEFGTSLSAGGSWVSAAVAAPNSRYVRCTIQQTGIAPWFMQVLGFGPQTVATLATATLSPAQTNCALPMAFCVLPGGTAPSYGYVPGNWYGLDFEDTGGPANYTGNFRWIDFDPSASTPGCSGGGAQELACLIAGTGQCSLPTPISGGCSSSGSSSPTPGCVGQNGNISSMETSYNSRFGVYKGGGGNPQLTTAPPDWTGYAYAWEGGAGNWPPGGDAYGGASGGAAPNFKDARNARLGTQNIGSISPDFYAPPYSPSDPGQHGTYGADRRLVTLPIVDCTSFTSGLHAPIRAYACVLLLDTYRKSGNSVRTKVEYIGLSNDPGSPCASNGIAGTSTSPGPLVPALVQ